MRFIKLLCYQCLVLFELGNKWPHCKCTLENFMAVLPTEDLDNLAFQANFVSGVSLNALKNVRIISEQSKYSSV